MPANPEPVEAATQHTPASASAPPYDRDGDGPTGAGRMSPEAERHLMLLNAMAEQRDAIGKLAVEVAKLSERLVMSSWLAYAQEIGRVTMPWPLAIRLDALLVLGTFLAILVALGLLSPTALPFLFGSAPSAGGSLAPGG